MSFYFYMYMYIFGVVLLRVRQAVWWGIFAFWLFGEIRRIPGEGVEGLDCFIQIGAFKVCDATQRISIYSSLVLLTTQALISRIFVPGMSNFVNSSVKRIAPLA